MSLFSAGLSPCLQEDDEGAFFYVIWHYEAKREREKLWVFLSILGVPNK